MTNLIRSQKHQLTAASREKQKQKKKKTYTSPFLINLYILHKPRQAEKKE